MKQDEVQTQIDARKAEVEVEVSKIKEKMDGLKSEMSDLKTHLYAKFGSAINLEADEE